MGRRIPRWSYFRCCPRTGRNLDGDPPTGEVPIMPKRPRIRPFLVVAIASSLIDARPAAGDQGGQLPRPPRARVVTLPRSPNDKPQETAVAVSPNDPRNVIVSYHQAVAEGSDHHFGSPVRASVATSLDG